MQCLIVDDDEMIRIDLEQRVKRMPGLTLAGVCGNATEAAGLIMSKKIDLLFLDVELPDMDGLKLLRMLDTNKRPSIIMITSRPEYAAEAFDYEVTDFLVKPISDERFLKAVMRASRLNQQQQPGAGNSPQNDHIFVRVNSVLEKINLPDILFVEAMADYVQIQCAKQRYVVHSTMKSIEQSLPSHSFFRVHNSYIVQLDKISKIEDNSVVIGEKLIPVSRSKIKALLEQINLLKGQ
jgi:DNA-binding LytR/AlgR family response regulator